MINFELINAYSCQPESSLTRWAKDENMAFCEGSDAFYSENRGSKLLSLITAIFTFIMK